MKSSKLLILIAGLLLAFLLSNVWADEETRRAVCKGKYGFTSDCVACHIPPTGEVGYPLPDGVRIYKDTAYIYVENIDFMHFRDRLLALKSFPVKKIVFDLFSYGGAVFDAMAMVALVEDQRAMGRVIEIRARGLIASAGLLILISGDTGCRYIEKNSLVMFHEIASFKYFAIERPSDKEEEALVYRKIQNKINSYITSRSKISLKELSDKIKKKEFWLDANEAVKYGFADAIMK